MMDKSRISQPGSSVSTARSLVASTSFWPATSTMRPFACCSRSAGSRAMISMTCCCRAALADRLAASRTAFSAQSALRPRNSANERMKATASLVTFAVMASPAGAAVFWSLPSSLSPPGKGGAGAPSSIGVAAPRLVPGAIAARWVA